MKREKIIKIISLILLMCILSTNMCYVYGVDLEKFKESEYESVNEFGSIAPIDSISERIFGNMFTIILLIVTVLIIIPIIVKRKNSKSYSAPNKKIDK